MVETSMSPTPPSAPSPNTWMPTAGGILSLISGAMGILSSICLVILAGAIREGVRLGRIGHPRLAALALIVIAIVMFIAGILAVISGILSLRRKNWGMSLTGAIAAIFTSSILGILATVFVAMSRKEFIK